MVDLLFPDPVLDTFAMTENERLEKRTGLICSHCHREIIGIVHRVGNKFYDDFCWQFRFILGFDEGTFISMEERERARDRIMGHEK